MNLLLNHIDQLSDSLRGRRFSPAFSERAQILTSALRESGGKELEGNSIRSVAAPTYATDLGVRYSPDPKEFYISHCRIAGLAPLGPKDITDALSDTSVSSFGSLLDALLLFFGDYEALAVSIQDNEIKLLESAPYSTLVECGVVLAALQNDDAISFFDRATECTSDKNAKYAAQHRAAATEIKRIKRPDRAIERLNHAKDDYIIESDPQDKVELALYHNLYALAILQSKQTLTSAELLGRSSENIESAFDAEVLGPVATSMAARYASQVAINKAQLKVVEKDFAEAKAILKRNLDFCISTVTDYVPEAQSEYAYACFLNRDNKESISWASRAFTRFFYIGDISGMRTCRQIVAASLAELGYDREGDRVASLVEKDPLGLEDLGGI